MESEFQKLKVKFERTRDKLKVSEGKARKYAECMQENRRQHILITDKIKECEALKLEVANMKELTDRVKKITLSN